MPANKGENVAKHFGRQLKKERLGKHWTLRQFTAESGIDIATTSSIENGRRPPNRRVAVACDRVFPHREGWFLEYFEDSQSYIPPGLRSWAEHEDPSAYLWVWSTTVVHGLLQTSGYARSVLEAVADVTPDAVTARLKSRMDRQQRVLYREDPPRCVFVLDLLSLYREVGSPEIMAEQLTHLLEVAERPNVVIQVYPAVTPPAVESGFILAGDAGYAEHVVGGGVYGDHAVERMRATFDTLRGESYRVSESLDIIRRLRDIWASGVSPLTAAATAGIASKPPAATE